MWVPHTETARKPRRGKAFWRFATETSYRVAYNVCLLYEPTRPAKAGSTIPIKLQLCAFDNHNVSSPSTIVTATGVLRVSDDASGPVDDAGQSNPDNNFRFDPSLGGTGGYIYNLSTAGLASGTYQLKFHTSADNNTYAVEFRVK